MRDGDFDAAVFGAAGWGGVRRVLVADGADDVVVPPRNSRMLARRIAGAQLKLYPDAGHAFLIQDQATFVPAVERFLRARDPGRS